MWAECCFRLLEYTRISSRYTTMETSIMLAKMSFMNLWKPAIGEPLGHHQPLKRPILGPESGLPFVAISDADEVVGMLRVDLGIDPGLAQSI